MAADGDHYILTFNAPVNVEDVYVRLESFTYQLMPGKDYIVVLAGYTYQLAFVPIQCHMPTTCTCTKVCIKTKQDDLGICQGLGFMVRLRVN